ncbi:hypothetical protein WP50_37200, partial [Lactiplantibacillus plantarum]
MMQVDGHVYPAANEALTLHGKFSDGTELVGEAEITAAHKSLECVWVTDKNGKEPQAVQPVIDAIIIRNYVNVVPPGDIRNVMVALSSWPDLYKDIFQYRFQGDDQFFAGHAIGNLIIAALTEMKSGVFD